MLTTAPTVDIVGAVPSNQENQLKHDKSPTSIRPLCRAIRLRGRETYAFVSKELVWSLRRIGGTKTIDPLTNQETITGDTIVRELIVKPGKGKTFKYGIDRRDAHKARIAERKRVTRELLQQNREAYLQ